MKKLITFLLLLLPITMMAQQTEFDQFFQKYSGKESYTTVDISTDFLKIIMGFTENDEDLKDLISNIERIRIVICEENNPTFVDDAKRLTTKQKAYKPITTVNSNGETTQIFVIKKENKITDFLLTSFSKSENIVINIVGKNLDVNKVSNLSKSVQIKGMDKL